MNLPRNKEGGFAPWNLAKSERPKAYSAGFSLLEMMAIISIISILSGVVYANVGEARKRARDAVRIRDITEISQALDLFVLNNGGFGSLPSITSSLGGGTSWSDFLQTLGLSSRVDPLNGTLSEGVTFLLGPQYELYQKHNYFFIRNLAGFGDFKSPVVCTPLEKKPNAYTPTCTNAASPPFIENGLPPLGCVMSSATYAYGSSPWICIKAGYYKDLPNT